VSDVADSVAAVAIDASEAKTDTMAEITTGAMRRCMSRSRFDTCVKHRRKAAVLAMG
jgi:hypothetical protein